jgi:hypothetical protein
MGLTVTTAATDERVVTVAALESILGTTSTLLAVIADRASDAVRSVVDVPSLGVQTYTETLAGSGDNFLPLSVHPIADITSVTLDSSIITDYVVDDKAVGILFRENGWRKRVKAFNTTLAQVPHFGREDPTDLSVVYTAGYKMPGSTATSTGVETLPLIFEQAGIEIVKDWFAGRKSLSNIKRKKIGPLEIEFALAQSLHGIPDRAEMLLARAMTVEGFA